MKKSWTGNKKSTFSTLGASNHSEYEREKHDYYATDPQAIDDLFAKEDFVQDIWEPACGEGHLSKRMEKQGKNVLSTDLVDRNFGDGRKDFLEASDGWHGDIITNPPYRHAHEFVEKSLQLIDNGRKVAMFLKLTFLESQKRQPLFQNTPPCRIYVYAHRMQVARNGDPEMFAKSSAACYAWFIWEKGNYSKPTLDWVTK